mgnify:CR=1 FL=1
MHVELLYHTPDPERAIATAARLCYAPVGAAELMETMSAYAQRAFHHYGQRALFDA